MKTKTILTILVFLGMFTITEAQDELKIQTTSTGDIYTFGFFSGQLKFNNGDTIGDPYSDNQGYFLARFDSAGNTKWVKHIKTKIQYCDGFCPGIGLCTDNDDNIYITGNFMDTIWFDSTNMLINSSWVEAFVAKYDSNGNFIWRQTPIGSDISRGIDIATDTSGNVYETGVFGGGSLTFDTLTPISYNSYVFDIYIVKFDSAGNGLWLQQLHGGGLERGSNHDVYSIFTDRNGNSYIVGCFGGLLGSTLNFGSYSVSTSGSYYEIYVAKCGPSGNPVWLKKVNSVEGTDVPEQIAVDDSNNIYFTGSFSMTAQFGTLPTVTAYNRDVFITQYDSLGNAQWVRQASPNSYLYSNEATGIAIDQLGKVFTVGYFNDTIEFPPLPPIPTNTGSGFLVKHDMNGSALCATNYSLDFKDISIDPFANVYTISGDARIFVSSYVSISKWDNDCSHLWNAEIKHIILFDGIEETQHNISAKVFPNPTSNILTIEVTNPLNKPVTIELYNMTGQLLIRESIDLRSQKKELNLTNSKNAVYILRIMTERETLTKRIIKI